MKTVRKIMILIVAIGFIACEELEEFKEATDFGVVDSVYYQEIDRQWAECDLYYDSAYYAQYSSTEWVCFLINDSIPHSLIEKYYMYYVDMVDRCDIDIHVRRCDN